MKKIYGILLVLIFIACNNEGADTSDPENIPAQPQAISFSMAESFPHDTSSYTQGLVIYKGKFYEGTGLLGKSKLMEMDLRSGKVIREKKLDDQYFGEGITILNDTLYQ